MLLVLWLQESTPKTRLSIASAGVSAGGAVLFVILSHLEHLRSVKPSSVLALFFFFTLLFDIPRARTQWAIPGLNAIPDVFIGSMGLKAIVFVLEVIHKPRLVKEQYFEPAPEAWSGIFSRAMFLWYNPLLWKGSRSTLGMDDLYHVETSMVPDHSKGKDILEIYWENSRMSYLC